MPEKTYSFLCVLMEQWINYYYSVHSFSRFQGHYQPLLSFCSIRCNYVSLAVQCGFMFLTWHVELNLCIIISVLSVGVHKVYHNELHLRLFVIQELVFSLHAACTNQSERYDQVYHMHGTDVYWQNHLSKKSLQSICD